MEYSLAAGLNAAVLVTVLERQLMALRIPKMQVWLHRKIFNLHEMYNSGSELIGDRGRHVYTIGETKA
jgi:hypothetical protein